MSSHESTYLSTRMLVKGSRHSRLRGNDDATDAIPIRRRRRPASGGSRPSAPEKRRGHDGAWRPRANIAFRRDAPPRARRPTPESRPRRSAALTLLPDLPTGSGTGRRPKSPLRSRGETPRKHGLHAWREPFRQGAACSAGWLWSVVVVRRFRVLRVFRGSRPTCLCVLAAWEGYGPSRR